MKSATLFGGAVNDRATKEYKETVEIGKILADNKYTVKSGGYVGLMEAVSKGAKDAGGRSIGYTCKTFGSVKGNEYLSHTVVADDIFDRLRYLTNAQVYIFQKGGVGTLSEFFLVWDIIRKKENHPTVYLIGDHWKLILESVQPITTDKENNKVKIVTLEEFKKEMYV